MKKLHHSRICRYIAENGKGVLEGKLKFESNCSGLCVGIVLPSMLQRMAIRERSTYKNVQSGLIRFKLALFYSVLQKDRLAKKIYSSKLFI
jgi:hypothetical protein